MKTWTHGFGVVFTLTTQSKVLSPEDLCAAQQGQQCGVCGGGVNTTMTSDVFPNPSKIDKEGKDKRCVLCVRT